jgi:glycosyltransferase involved in cell wall biosynthesis
MEDKKLSIIIPCFNCEKTIKEAVDSIYTQGLNDFEIIMIDDKSTDSTYEKLTQISKEYPEVKVFSNEKNLGGGATRNKAVNLTSNEYVFCLDSDDILGEKTLSKILSLISEKNLDGVGVSTSIKFKNENKSDVLYTSNFGYINEIIPPISLFENDTCSLYSVFMFKKESFLKVGGYPSDHGFDTQGLAFRFILNGLNTSTCPDTIYYHRTSHGKSYYIREYESGKLNHNWYKVFEEFLYVFDKDIQETILNFDLNNPSKILFDEVRKKISKDKININNQKNNSYWLAWKAFREKNYVLSQELFEKFIRENSNNLYSHYYLDLCTKETNTPSNLIDLNKIDYLFSYKKQGSEVNILVRIFRKILRKIYAPKN